MKAIKYSLRHANAVHVLDRFLNGECLTADEIRMYDDQGRVIEYINNKLLVPVSRTRIKQEDEYIRAWYLNDKDISDYHYDRERQIERQSRTVLQARQLRKAVTTADLLSSLGESVPESIRAIIAANDIY